MKKIAISQSNYIPWLGYFQLIDTVDEFIFFDEVQYTRRDWRDRNKIKCQNNIKWLTIPVKNKGNYKEKISKIEIQDEDWIKKHVRTIELNYCNSKYFNLIFPQIYNIYSSIPDNKLSNINQHLIVNISRILNIKTSFKKSSDFKSKLDNKDPSARLVEICKTLNANHYYTGPNAINYIDQKKFIEKKINLNIFNYEKNLQLKYKNYSKLSIIDHLMNFGVN